MGISIIILCLILSAFFRNGNCIYFFNKIYLERKNKITFYQNFTKLTEKPSKFIAAMLIGNNIALVVYGF
jgi:Mg2+/Co2+ transporter CorB